ncbi:MAG: RDD family protein [Maricaulis sp.]|nr:RDD family protein [Maricaulis sp.]
MKPLTIDRRIAVVIFGLAIILPQYLSPHGGLGVLSVTTNNNLQILVQGHWTYGLASLGILLSPLIFATPARADNLEAPVRIRRRMGAVFVDLIVVMQVLVPIPVLALIIIEAQATGEFAWAFQRDFARPTDDIIFFSAAAIMLGIIGYIYWSLKTGTQTLGQYLLGFRVLADPDRKKPGSPELHIFLATIFGSVWPVNLLLAARSKDRRFWWSKVAGMRPVRVEKI